LKINFNSSNVLSFSNNENKYNDAKKNIMIDIKIKDIDNPMINDIKSIYNHNNGKKTDKLQENFINSLLGLYTDFKVVEKILIDIILWSQAFNLNRIVYSYNDNDYELDFSDINRDNGNDDFQDHINEIPDRIEEQIINHYVEEHNNQDNEDIVRYYNSSNHLSNQTNDVFKISYFGIPFNLSLDMKGELYLIHPFEDRIQRNIYGEIISVDGIKSHQLEHKIYHNILGNLINNNYILDISKTYDPYNSTIDGYFIKTKLSDYIDYFKNETNMQQDINISSNDIITLFASNVMGCFIEVYSIITFLNCINKNITQIIKPKVKYLTFYNQYSRDANDSDIILIYRIILMIKKQFNYEENPTYKWEHDMEMIRWCDDNLLNRKVILTFIKKMGKKEIINIFTKPLEEVADDKMNIEDLQDLVMDIRSKSNDVITEDKEEAILKSFIYGNLF
jgi:hypothetical protein